MASTTDLPDYKTAPLAASEIARGLDVFELTPTKSLTQNEIDAAEAVRVSELNVQNQERIEWPRTLGVARAYLDQLERTQALPARQIATAGDSNCGTFTHEQNGTRKTQELRTVVEEAASVTSNVADSSRLRALAEILKQPVR